MPNPNPNSRPFSPLQNFPRGTGPSPRPTGCLWWWRWRLSDGNPGTTTARPQQAFFKKALLMAGTFFGLLVAVCLGSQPAHASHDIRFCNQTPKTIYAVWGSIKGNPLSKGLYKLSPSQCRTVTTSRPPGYLYAGAKAQGTDLWWRGGQKGEGFFCVNFSGSRFYVEKDGASYRDINKSSGWNTCTGLGSDYGSRPLSKSPGTFKSERIRRNPWHVSYYEYARVCTAKFQADFRVSWSCDSWYRTN